MRLALSLFLLPVLPAADFEAKPTFHTEVDMVTLAFRVEKKNRFVTGLNPADIHIFENGREQQIRTFSHPESAIAIGPAAPESIFLLVDTSNAMYSGFAHARDAIAEFIRSLDPKHAVAVYTFSRNVARAAPLTTDRQVSIGSLMPSAGEDTALYNAMLLVLRDAAQVPGPKKMVVFSSGVDNMSQVSPDDVSRVAADLGIPIYVVSRTSRDPISTAAWSRITSKTGGSVHVAGRWKHQRRAFQHIHDDIRNTYTITYYSNNMAPGYRKIDVQIREGKYAITCRPGYYAPERRDSSAQLAATAGE